MRLSRKKWIWSAIVVLGAAVAAVAYIRLTQFHGLPAHLLQPTPAPDPNGPGWIDLLSAEHARHWENVTDDKNIFQIEDGMLHIFGDTIYPLRYAGYTGRDFSDFELHLEYRLANRANSGVFLRTNPDDPVYRGFEVQILDDFGKPPTRRRSGAIYDVVTPMFNASRPAGEWNSLDISMRGLRVKVILNGVTVIDTDFTGLTEPVGKHNFAYANLPPAGMLLLQDHGGEIHFRNVLIHPLDEP